MVLKNWEKKYKKDRVIKIAILFVISDFFDLKVKFILFYSISLCGSTSSLRILNSSSEGGTDSTALDISISKPVFF